MKSTRALLVSGALLLLAGCVSLPSGPSVMVLPGNGKDFNLFRTDDMDCRQFASYQTGGSTPNDAAAGSVATSAVVGTAIGAVAGAAFGGSQGAAVGAGTGLLVGGLSGASAGGYSQYELQRRYDNGYVQCMYSKGHKVPTSGNYSHGNGNGSYGNGSRQSSGYSTPPPPPPNARAPVSSNIPPPPSGTPPAPPPGVN
jgi:hypothetical protein